MRAPRDLVLLGFFLASSGCGADGAAASGASTPDGAPPETAHAAADAGIDAASAEGSRPLRVFVSADGFTGNFTTLAGVPDGLAAADVLCNRAAADANLGGEFVAYLSVHDPDAGVDVRAWDRIQGDGPWVAVGTEDVIVPDRDALLAEALPAHRKLRTERGEPLLREGSSPTSPMVWTGTPKDVALGTKDTCSKWTRAKGAKGGLVPGMCGCLGEQCKADDWREHRYGLYPGLCFCENPEPYRHDQPRLYCFERR